MVIRGPSDATYDKSVFTCESLSKHCFQRSESSPIAGRDSLVWKCPHLCQEISSLAIKQGLDWERDGYTVIHLGNTRCGPGGFLRRLFLSIGTYRPTQDDLAALQFDRDTAGIRLRIADERLLDLLLQVFWRKMRSHYDEVGDAFDT